MGKTDKTRSRRKPRAKKAGVSKSFAKQFNKMLPSKERRRVMQTDLYTSPYLIPIANIIDNLTTCVQGTNIDQRLHNSIYVSYINLKGSLAQKVSIDKTRVVRIIILQEINYLDFNGATMANLFKDNVWTDQAPDGTANVSRWMVNRDRFMVYFDKRYTVGPKSDLGTRLINEDIKIGRVYQYPQKDPTYTDPIGGRLMGICLLSEPDDLLTADAVHLELQWRIFFKDYRKIFVRNKNK